MININVTPNGEINISQETADERAQMHRAYEYGQDVKEDAGAGEPSFETQRDEENSKYFKSGWDSCLQEVQINFVNGRLPEFFNEVGLKTGTEDPHHAEPEGTGEEGWGEPTDDYEGLMDDLPAAGWADMARGIDEGIAEQSASVAEVTEALHAANEIGLSTIRPVKDSGEPELEHGDALTDADLGIAGTWTMSNDELNSRINEAYRRGQEDADKTKPITSEQTIHALADEVAQRVHPEGMGSFLVRPFAVQLAKSLGWDVAS
ncbi:hypothetical protein SEA_SPARCETUS_75 [Microbacterium phage Sparcetus]|nr:hypothetical protein SEA_SPARCETUS_75 [Microbacterium phage Sparcetus]